MAPDRQLNAPLGTVCKNRDLLVVLGLENLFATIETVRADVVTHVRLAAGRFNRQLRGNQKIVRTMHATLGRGLFILLNSHDNS